MEKSHFWHSGRFLFVLRFCLKFQIRSESHGGKVFSSVVAQNPVPRGSDPGKGV